MATVLIPARYNSSRFPGKIIADICGKPMIVRVAEQCLKSSADRVIVATDSDIVQRSVENAGIECVVTPQGFQTGTDRIAWVAEKLDDDIIINVQGDEPFIAASVIDGLINQLVTDPELKMNTACVKFCANDDSSNPSHVKVVFNTDYYALYFSRSEIPYAREIKDVIRYKHIGIYGFRKDFLLSYSSMPKSLLEEAEMLEQLRAIENGIQIKMFLTDYKPISIDTKEDLDIAVNYYKSLNKE